MSNLPDEMIRHIISYHENPDVRRSFGLYERIDLHKFSILNTIMRTLNPEFHHAHDGYLYQQYKIPNIYSFTERKCKEIKNDCLDMKICDYNNKIYYNFGIYRLKPAAIDYSSNREFPCDNKTVDGYQWNYLMYSFILEH